MIKKYAGDKITGISSDTKPSNVSDGATFYETDTLKMYVRASSTWVQLVGGKRVTSETSSATPTINVNITDIHRITAQTVDITSMTTNLSGTPTHGQQLIIEITGTASRAITWGASFEATTVALPTTTSGTETLRVGFMWNTATSKFSCVAVA